jgi:enoyl-[acyl-carrier protein] reductase II
MLAFEQREARLPIPRVDSRSSVPYRVLRTDLVKSIEGREDQTPPAQPGDSPIGETVLFPFTLRVPYTMPPFSAVVPTPDTTGAFDLMGFPAGEDSVRKIKALKPAAEIIAEMMAEAREILREELAATSD